MNKPRILIVEDEAIVARDLSGQLTGLGYEPAGQAANGEDALVLAEQLHPDLVLMDIHLNGSVDGIAAAQAIRERFAIPVVFLSAYLEESILDRAKAAQPFGYVTKPFQSSELRMVIDLALTEHQSEIRLRQAYEEQAAILRTAMDGFWMVDMQGRFLEVNDAYCRMTGFTPEELLRLSIADVEVDESPDEIAANIEKVKHAGCIRLERRHRCKDGHLIDTEVSVRYLPALGGRMVCFVRDITEHRRAEQALRASEQEFRTLAEAMPQIVWATRPDGWNIYFNQQWVDYTGLTLEESYGHGWNTPFHPDDRQRAWDAWQRATQKIDTYALECRLRRADGAYRWWLIRGVPLRNASGEILKWFGTCTDIENIKQAEEALRNSEIQLRAILDATPFPIALVDVQDYRIEFWSRSALTLFGHTAPTATEWHQIAYPDPDYRREVIERWKPALEKARLSAQAVNTGVYRVACHNGSVRICELYAAFLPDKLIVTFNDITERKEAEEALRKNMAMLSEVIDSVPQSIFWKDRHSVYLGCNEVFARAIGLSDPKLVVGKTDFDLPSPRADAEAYRADDRSVMESGQPKRHIIEPLQQADGSRLWVDTTKTPLLDADGRVYGILGVYEDITERKRTEEALCESEKLLRESQIIAGLGSYVLNIPTGRWKSSDVLDKLFGIDKTYERSVEAWEALIHADDRSMMVDHLRNEVLGQVRAFNKEYRIIRHDNQAERWVHGLGKLEFDAQGRLQNMRGTIQDITERKRAEAEKASLEGQFQQAQKMESVGRLAGGVAHDFNNMLGVILGNVELAMEQVDRAQPLFAELEEIRKAARRSADLTRQLLAFARRQTVAPKVLDLNEAVEGLLKMLRRLIGENIHLAWLPAADLAPVKLDPIQIDQILANLCVNARDAIGGVGKVTIETGNAVFDEAYCADHPGFVPGAYVMLAVSDDGCGMDKETQAQIFEPFFTTKGVGEGTGLGLATIYGIVKQNHGFIHVYSEPGQGTTFKLYLPRHAGQAATTGTKSAVKLPRSAGEMVLLVEDEPSILAIAQRVLERLGYTVLTASTPGEAIRLAGAHAGEIHLLMTDVVMPEMNGRDLARQLLSLHPKLKYLFMSGYTADVIAHQGVLDEGVHFIQKPFSVEDLATKVRKALEGQ